ncbi:MAG: hypothetical protein QNJ74_08495 [Trichodesmium sp. MO_231.B1]|nr:hypothetical protein [Trichodesmium sp. MO_231.B1]
MSLKIPSDLKRWFHELSDREALRQQYRLLFLLKLLEAFGYATLNA